MKNFHLPIKLSRPTFISSFYVQFRDQLDIYDLDIFLTLFLSLQLYVRERFGVLLVSSAIYLAYPKPADRGLRLGTSFFISHSRFGVLVDFFLVCAVVSDPEERMSSADRRKNRPRKFRVLCTRELPENEIKTSLSDKSTIPGFSCLYAPWHRYVPIL